MVKDMGKTLKSFWKDLNWARKHHTELLKKYRNLWVAVVNKKVVSAGDNLEKVEDIAKAKTGKKNIATMFVDGGEHIYGC
ncbi:MAG: DUF5678 domain-containing protein [Thermoplasmatales archaeon]|nr:DUF5678 domain-containing protein [Thermoplasmatales archaeon]